MRRVSLVFGSLSLPSLPTPVGPLPTHPPTPSRLVVCPGVRTPSLPLVSADHCEYDRPPAAAAESLHRQRRHPPPPTAPAPAPLVRPSASMSEDRAAEAVVREMLSSLQQKFKLSDAHCKLIAKDIEEIATEPPDRRAQIVGQIEKEIAQSVSQRGREGRGRREGEERGERGGADLERGAPSFCCWVVLTLLSLSLCVSLRTGVRHHRYGRQWRIRQRVQGVSPTAAAAAASGASTWALFPMLTLPIPPFLLPRLVFVVVVVVQHSSQGRQAGGDQGDRPRGVEGRRPDHLPRDHDTRLVLVPAADQLLRVGRVRNQAVDRDGGAIQE